MATAKKAAPKKAAAKKTASKKASSEKINFGKKIIKEVIMTSRNNPNFKNGRLVTNDPELINALRGSQFNAENVDQSASKQEGVQPLHSMVGPALNQSNGVQGIYFHGKHLNDLSPSELMEFTETFYKHTKKPMQSSEKKADTINPVNLERPSFLALTKAIKANLGNQAKLLDFAGTQIEALTHKIGFVSHVISEVRSSPSEEDTSLYGQLDDIDVIVNRHSDIIDILFHHLENLTNAI